MYLFLTVTIVLLILLFCFFDLEVNINIISCVIIILLLNSLYYRNTYEKFNNINNLHDSYQESLDKIKNKYEDRTKKEPEKYKFIPIYSSKFNTNIFESLYNDVPIECKGIPFNGEYLSGSDFISLLDKLNNVN
jgi:hypothetical protein